MNTPLVLGHRREQDATVVALCDELLDYPVTLAFPVAEAAAVVDQYQQELQAVL
jgi:hypothetical protein